MAAPKNTQSSEGLPQGSLPSPPHSPAASRSISSSSDSNQVPPEREPPTPSSSTAHDDRYTSAYSPPTPSSDIQAVQELLASMQRQLTVMGTTFELIGAHATKLAVLAPVIEAEKQIQQIRHEGTMQLKKQEQRIADVKHGLAGVISDHVAKELQPRVAEIIKGVVAGRVKEKVHQELTSQISSSLIGQLRVNQLRLLDVKMALHNSEARRYNATLRTNSLQEPLRPLLRPLAMPTSARFSLPSPTSPSSPSNFYNPVTPAQPAPPPVTPMTPRALHRSYSSTSPSASSSPYDPLAPSPLFPPNLKTLFNLDIDAARALIREYGLVPESAETLDDERMGSGGNSEEVNGSVSREEGVWETREDTINKFMNFIGVTAVRLTPATPISPSDGKPMLRLPPIITSTSY
ncbi:hypothetical protein JAAARDRAFT_37715 [Jaapia argillacea MUCL 33604]|uniref:Uncharacterized protein n=1 Tax=Jaapia argillacea MUCL 33604 TaxID=933084 RepID=A0A067PJV1_9AGAM|nr:hypothetical protein JAAARDRAFT_37715 [Jaapia argillacea MUCL 33604]